MALGAGSQIGNDGQRPMDRLPRVAPGPGFMPLDNVRVLDLTTSVAGPYGAMLLGDLGADVVKVERPGGGDDARGWGPPFLDGQSLWFLSVNRNKRSLVLDTASASGRDVLAALVTAADVVMVNQPLRTLTKLGTDPVALQAINPRVIYAAITGFGLSGERADWTCYDLIAEGYSGVMDLTGEAIGEPQKIGTPAADMLAGQDAAFAVLAALIDRGRTGKGRVIDVALVDSMTRFLTCRIVPFLGTGEVPRRSGGRDSVIAIYQAFDTADRPITLGLGTDAIWRRFWEAIGQPERGLDAATATNPQRRAKRADLVAEIAALIAEKPRSHWLTLFARVRVPAGPINALDEVVADAGLLARGMFYTVESDGRAVPQVGTGWLLDGVANAPRRLPPQLGAHSTDVLDGWLGYDAARIAQLARDGTIEEGPAA